MKQRLYPCIFLFVCLLVSFASVASAQEAKEIRAQANAPSQNHDPFFEDYFHTYNSDYQFYFMRERLHLNTVLASVSTNLQESGAQDSEIKAFLPIYYGESFSFLVPIYSYHFPLTEEQSEGLGFDSVRNFFWQAIFNIHFNDSATLALITESHHIGTEDTQWDLAGSDVAEFVLLELKLSDTWTIAPAFRAKVAWDDQEQTSYDFTPAGHVIWRPSSDISLMTGVPSLFALEWDAPWSVDLAAHVTLGEGNINGMFAVRKGLHEQWNIGARYLRDGYEGIFVPSVQTTEDGDVINQISQYKNRAQLELEYFPTPHTMMQLKGGYGFDEGVRLLQNDTLRETRSGQDGWYGGFTLTAMYDLD